MYYISNTSLTSAIKQLHSSGTHDYFRIYLVLKMLGLKFGSNEPVTINTNNPTPALKVLFKVEDLLPVDRPFYNPLRNEQLKEDHGRGVIQTTIVKWYKDGKMKNLFSIAPSPNRAWLVRFSSEYPRSLGRDGNGLAAKNGTQITIHTPSFVLWMNRDGEWQDKPTFDQLWTSVKEKLNLHDVEIDLLFDKTRAFETDPFTEDKPDRSQLINFIRQQIDRGTGEDVLKPPPREAFSDDKIQRIILSYRRIEQASDWWRVESLEDEAREVLQESRSLLLVGPPGTGKTRLANELARIIVDDEAHVHRFQFHASYAYEDFIEALVPVPVEGSLKFEPVAKRFLQACQNAEQQPQVVILDEFNRADVSKVFGEAFSLIEMEYRESKYAIPRLYKPDERFWIPPDLYIIATLNDLDKSTYDLDFALRRRFGQVNVLPDPEQLEQMMKKAGCTDEDFIRITRSVFNELQSIYPLGHAYFKNVRDRDSLKAVYRRVIRPTIAAYLGQYRKADLEKVDSIIREACEVCTWEDYIGADAREEEDE